jgi:hypothetical protein
MNRPLSLFIAGLALAALCLPKNAFAIPSFAAQTGQPCSACHIGAFGPQLKPYGRDFKLDGYTSSDRPNDNIVDNWYERFTTSIWGSFNRTDKDMPPSPGGVGYGPNDNFSLDQAALYFGGRITPHVGAIAEYSYDGANKRFFWDAMDLRYAHDGELFDQDYVAGLVVGNQLGNTSVWNSTPPNGFPYNASRIAPTPQAGTIFDDSLNGQIFGPGLYFSNDWINASASVYMPVTRGVDRDLGDTQSDLYRGPLPYWQFGFQHDFDHHNHYMEIGTFGTVADRYPGADHSTGFVDHIADNAAEATYQYLPDNHNMVSAHAVYIHESQDLNASSVLNGTNASDYLNEFRADVTYSIDDTYVPTVQYFQITGSKDAALYTSSNTVSGSPDSRGFTVDLGYVPFGKPDSPINWGNARFALEYTAYTQFNGSTHNASDNNTVFLNFIIDLAPLVPIFSHDPPPS